TDGVSICTAANAQYFPMLVADGAGGAVITWQDQRTGEFDIYAQRVNASGASQWTGDGVALCLAGGDQLNPLIVTDGSGGGILTWTDYRTAGTYLVFAQHVQ